MPDARFAGLSRSFGDLINRSSWSGSFSTKSASCAKGKNSYAIFSGTPVSSQYPFVGAITLGLNESVGVCTGTLVCSNVVMTAAHCFEDHIPLSSYRFSTANQVNWDELSGPATGQATQTPVDLQIHPARQSTPIEASRGPYMAFLRLPHSVSAQPGRLGFEEISYELESYRI